MSERFVPKTGVYRVKQGETIIPERQVKKIPRIQRVRKVKTVKRVGRLPGRMRARVKVGYR